MHDVAFAYEVVLALEPELASFLGGVLTAQGDEVCIGRHFGADEAAFKVGVDAASGLGCRRTGRNGPGTYLAFADGEKGQQLEKFVARVDHPVEAGLGKRNNFV